MSQIEVMVYLAAHSHVSSNNGSCSIDVFSLCDMPGYEILYHIPQGQYWYAFPRFLRAYSL